MSKPTTALLVLLATAFAACAPEASRTADDASAPGEAVAGDETAGLGQAQGQAQGSADAGTPFTTTRPAWCAELPRPIYASLPRVPIADDWFQVYRVADGVLAIYEPHQFQEVISYLVVGQERALLFDTGMGLGRIGGVVDELTRLPVVVLNSHTHPDHVGGNAEFDEVLALDTEYTRRNARGYEHDAVASQVAPDALCRPLPGGLDSAEYRIRPFGIAGAVDDGAAIDLGGRELEVLHIPGHTPDAVALLDRANGLLFTGDTFYEGPIYLFSPETDVAAYARSVERLAALVPELRRVLPGHNSAVSAPSRLLELRDAVRRIRSGRADGERTDGLVEYDFGAFSVLLRSEASP